MIVVKEGVPCEGKIKHRRVPKARAPFPNIPNTSIGRFTSTATSKKLEKVARTVQNTQLASLPIASFPACSLYYKQKNEYIRTMYELTLPYPNDYIHYC